jgi:hypothetical protein
MSKDSEAYKAQAKAPKKGVKADDADEYQAKGSDYDKSVSKGKAYAQQDVAPKGMGSRGPSQADGGPIAGWDKHVQPYGAYGAQEKAPQKGSSKSETASLGFKLPSKGTEHLGHFAQEKFLRAGHNDAGSVSDFLFGTGDNESPTPTPTPTPKPKPSPSPDNHVDDEKGKNFRKGFNGDD